ncbi:MAG: coproporphyrinogen-III oxidase family protein, partial [Thermoguttaceae bacterium]
MSGTSPPIGLYVHVPFCVRKCAYCDFASYAGREADLPRYVDAVVQEIARRGRQTGHPAVDTIFLGGGTPSLLSASQAARLLDALADAFAIRSDAEITCEGNPGTLTQPFARALRTAGVNRLSLGAQAAPSRLLQLLGRIHDWTEVIASVEISRQSGFENLNVDLMFGVPSQSLSEWRETLEAAMALRPEHLSCYSLTVE